MTSTSANRSDLAVYRSVVDPDDYVPFDGFDAVLSGEPRAAVSWLRTVPAGDGVLYAGMFTVEPSVFRYSFLGDESFHVLDGDLDIAVDGGDTVTLGPGDIASFTQGSVSTWTV